MGVSTIRGSAFEEVADDAGNALEVVVGEFGINGKAEAFAGGFFSNGEIASAIAKGSVALLEVQREGVMEGTADLVGLEMLFQIVAARMADDVKVINAFGVAGFLWQLKRSVSKQFVIAMSDASAFAGPVIKVLEFDAEHRALDAFHAIIVADFVVVIADTGAVFAQ